MQCIYVSALVGPADYYYRCGCSQRRLLSVSPHLTQTLSLSSADNKVQQLKFRAGAAPIKPRKVHAAAISWLQRRRRRSSGSILCALCYTPRATASSRLFGAAACPRGSPCAPLPSAHLAVSSSSRPSRCGSAAGAGALTWLADSAGWLGWRLAHDCVCRRGGRSARRDGRARSRLSSCLSPIDAHHGDRKRCAGVAIPATDADTAHKPVAANNAIECLCCEATCVPADCASDAHPPRRMLQRQQPMNIIDRFIRALRRQRYLTESSFHFDSFGCFVCRSDRSLETELIVRLNGARVLT